MKRRVGMLSHFRDTTFVHPLESDTIVLLDDSDEGSEPASDEDCIIVDDDARLAQTQRPVTQPPLSLSANGRDEYRVW